MSDDEIQRHWKDDPPQGFRLLYERYADVLLRFVYRFTGNQEQAEEILQDIFSEVLKADLTAPDFQIKSWLFTVAKNKSLNFERKKKREVASEIHIQQAVDPGVLEEQLAYKQILHQISYMQKKLPTDLMETWRLRQEGMDYQQIADTLGIPIGTVKSRFSRLVEYFKKEFKIGKLS